MSTFLTDVNFDNNQAVNLTLQTAVTASLDAALIQMGSIGYDVTALRAKINDGQTIRKLLQDNDVATGSLSAAVSGNFLLATATAVKNYIDNAVTLNQQPFVDVDASTTSTFPAGATLASRYRVSVAGTIQGVILQVGDIFWPKINAPGVSTPADWIFAQGNVDYATGTTLGLVQLAILSEIQSNSTPAANKVITVSQLNAWETALGRIKKFTLLNQSLAIGTTAITHNLNSTTVVVQLWDANGQLFSKITRPSAQQANIIINKARSGVDIVILA